MTTKVTLALYETENDKTTKGISALRKEKLLLLVFILYSFRNYMTKRKNVMHIGKWAALLTIFWLLLSGYIQPLLLSFGAISVIIVLIVLSRMDAVDKEPISMNLGFRMIRYLTWLMGQIVISSVEVTQSVWGSTEKLSPSLAKIPAKDLPKKAHVLYANSITLTPGTLSVDLEDDEITVHALHQSSIDALREGEIEQKISRIWGDEQ